MSIYLDNAATSHPKPSSVYRAVEHALKEVGGSPGRASHRQAREASAIVESARQKAALLFGIEQVGRVVFTKNATESINLVLKGWLEPGHRVVVSSMEHNAVIRPLKRLSEDGVQVDIVPCGSDGQLDLKAFQKCLDTPPRLVVLTHASNINGSLQPVGDVARICAEHDTPFLLDAAQTAGIQPIMAGRWNLGMLACSGHKGLLGPPGVGILYIRADLNVKPLIEGGTGSKSEQDIQPDFSPDCYESGTPNLPGIAGLGAGIDFINEHGMTSILQHELSLASRLEAELMALPGIRVYQPGVRGTSTVSFTAEGLNPADLGYLLDQGFDIAVRAGLHCAPLAHRTLGTFPEGTVRVSPGFFTTSAEIARFLDAIRTLISRRL